MADFGRPGPLPRGRGRDGIARGRYRRAQGGRTGLAAGASPALHLGHQRQGRRPARPALSAVHHRPRRPAHLSRPRPAGGLCDARPQAPPAGRARLCGRPRRMDHPHARRLQRARRAPRGSRRRLGQAAGQGRRLRGQDRGDRRAAAALGVVPRHRHQCRAGAVAFFRDRALRRRRSALRRHLAGRSRPARDDGGCRRRAPAGV